MILNSPILSIIFLLCASLVAGTITTLIRLGRTQTREEFRKNSFLIFSQEAMNKLFAKKAWEGTFFSLNFTKTILLMCYAASSFFFLLAHPPFSNAIECLTSNASALNGLWVLAIAVVSIVFYLTVDFCINLISLTAPKFFLKTLSIVSIFLMLIFSPFAALLFKILKTFVPSFDREGTLPSFRIREKILEVFQESEIGAYLDKNDQKLLLSLVSFKERIAREVMVPRIDIFSLPADMTLKEAAKSILSERYSRIPVYRENVDDIIGVLLYKDVLNIYARSAEQKEQADQLNLPIENFLKPVLYAPETKKISHLLQEFRSKQIHLAIVVDEYGGTEGIVTIEDILEELVGEIADEYDISEEVMYSVLPSGGWIVDAKMSIIDIEEELGIKIPHSPEYDTIGGYIFHRAGSIPSKGWKIHHDEFDLEILSSNERSIGKIKIIPNIRPHEGELSL
ncbi:MAG TPA: hemolysin family protein [Rhabdochlamydiaceae bacterium]|nr:hemolysin family protein [Rhabdochlamydiaceae bacterium]